MFAATTAFGALRSILWPKSNKMTPTSPSTVAAALEVCASDPCEDDGDDESARLERIYMSSSPRERADACVYQ